MAIKKYRVAHAAESIILGVLICSGLAIWYASGEKPNMEQNKEIVHLNKIYQDKLAEETAQVGYFKKFKDNVSPYGIHQNDADFNAKVAEILETSKKLSDQLVDLNMLCKNTECKEKVEELLVLLGIE